MNITVKDYSETVSKFIELQQEHTRLQILLKEQIINTQNVWSRISKVDRREDHEEWNNYQGGLLTEKHIRTSIKNNEGILQAQFDLMKISTAKLRSQNNWDNTINNG